MATPELHLATAFVFAGERRITETREPGASAAARFVLARGPRSVAWAVRSDVSTDVAAELDGLAAREPAHTGDDWHTPPRHAERYAALLATDLANAGGGPLFEFPAELAAPSDIVPVTRERDLATHFRRWVDGEIADGRAPVMAIVEDGAPVSICFCARRSRTAAEAGVDTAERFRRRGYAARVTAAWALALRARGMTPLYSTSWANEASRGVARRLGLVTYGTAWTMG